MGFALVITGMIGSVVCGILLDKTKKFKEITLGLYVLSMLGMFAYTFVLSVGSIWPTFAVTSALGESLRFSLVPRNAQLEFFKQPGL